MVLKKVFRTGNTRAISVGMKYELGEIVDVEISRVDITITKKNESKQKKIEE